MQFEKHLLVTSSSRISWKDAINQAIAEASKTLDNISCVKVLEQRADIQDEKIEIYYVDLDLCFIVDKNRS